MNTSDEYYDIPTIIEWYSNNVNTPLNEDFFKYIITMGIIDYQGVETSKTALYPLLALNRLLLIQRDGEFVKNDNGLYMVKKNRLTVINKKKEKKQETTPNKDKKFKLTNIGGNKLKLIKIN